MLRVDPYFEAVKPAVKSNNGWSIPTAPVEQPKPEWYADEDKKRAFGTRLGKGDKPLDAALFVLDNRMSDGLWAVQNWLRDPLVIETREIIENEINLLDKDQLSVKLLKFAEERNQQGHPIHESKDRLAALKLYAEIQGYIGKVNVDLSKNTFTNNEMQITFVEAEKEKEITVIEHRQEEHETTNDLQVSLKLVG